MMKPEISLAAVALLSLLGALLVHDYVRSQNSRRVLAVQGAVFAVGGLLIVYPDIATRLAHAVGIGRGVDFVIYPLVIWLVRESLVSRRRRREDDERMTELVRAVASDRARVVHSSGIAPEQSAASSAS
jgi:hypothetical protein